MADELFDDLHRAWGWNQPVKTTSPDLILNDTLVLETCVRVSKVFSKNVAVPLESLRQITCNGISALLQCMMAMRAMSLCVLGVHKTKWWLRPTWGAYYLKYHMIPRCAVERRTSGQDPPTNHNVNIQRSSKHGRVRGYIQRNTKQSPMSC